MAEPLPELLGDVRRVRLDERHGRLRREPGRWIEAPARESSFTSSITAAIGVLNSNTN